jgi:hypothetical protein
LADAFKAIYIQYCLETRRKTKAYQVNQLSTSYHIDILIKLDGDFEHSSKGFGGVKSGLIANLSREISCV